MFASRAAFDWLPPLRCMPSPAKKARAHGRHGYVATRLLLR
jgi:hypothetical protein